MKVLRIIYFFINNASMEAHGIIFLDRPSLKEDETVLLQVREEREK